MLNLYVICIKQFNIVGNFACDDKDKKIQTNIINTLLIL